jgi:hypothetical protein
MADERLSTPLPRKIHDEWRLIMADPQYIGLYSARAAELCGSSIYATPDGGTVEVTAVGSSDTVKDSYKWNDAINVGPVTKWLRVGTPNPNPFRPERCGR